MNLYIFKASKLDKRLQFDVRKKLKAQERNFRFTKIHHSSSKRYLSKVASQQRGNSAKRQLSKEVGQQRGNQVAQQHGQLSKTGSSAKWVVQQRGNSLNRYSLAKQLLSKKMAQQRDVLLLCLAGVATIVITCITIIYYYNLEFSCKSGSIDCYDYYCYCQYHSCLQQLS